MLNIFTSNLFILSLKVEITRQKYTLTTWTGIGPNTHLKKFALKVGVHKLVLLYITLNERNYRSNSIILVLGES